MLKRTLAVALGWLALTGMQAPPAAGAAAAVDCGGSIAASSCSPIINAFFSDTSEYPAGPKRLVGSCYLIRHGDRYMLWDTGLPGGAGRPADQTIRR